MENFGIAFNENMKSESEKTKQVLRTKIFFLVFYTVCFLLMAIWRNKAISHSYMFKSMIVIVKVALGIREMHYEQTPMLFEAMEDGIITFEETLAVLLFHELYCCICKMKKRVYKVHWLLLKAFVLLLFAVGWMHLFSYVDFMLNTNWAKLRRIIWSSVMTLLLLFFVVKIVITLLGGWNFRERLTSNNFFLVGLIAVTVASQLTSLSVHISQFVIKKNAYDMKLQCGENIMSSQFDGTFGEAMLLILQCEATHIESAAAVPYLSTELGRFIECLFCSVIMLYRKCTTKCFNKGPAT